MDEMKRIFLIVFSLSFFWSGNILAQDAEEEAYRVHGKDTVFPLRDGRFILNEKIYKQNSPYLTLAYGAGMNHKKSTIEQNLLISYHHFINNIGLTIGYHASSDIQVWWRSYQKQNDLYLGAGKRFEGLRYNIGLFAGPSLAYGSYIDWSEEDGENRAFGYNALGGFAEIQMTYRIFYDIGVGLSLYGSYNKYYTVSGAQIHLFFSTAYVREY
jgi:hypothetical protein